MSASDGAGVVDADDTRLLGDRDAWGLGRDLQRRILKTAAEHAQIALALVDQGPAPGATVVDHRILDLHSVRRTVAGAAVVVDGQTYRVLAGLGVKVARYLGGRITAIAKTPLVDDDDAVAILRR